ncbi:Crustacean hyperglycemic hormone, partial [Armadillidium vulgare]
TYLRPLQMSISSVAMCLVIFFSLAEIFECRGVDNLGLEDFGPAGMKAKRRIFDTSCKGFYDRGLFAQLDRVCEDCYNLYRKPHVAAECRRDCYTTEVFESCLKDLMMHDFINEYKEMALMVSGKK